MIDRRGFLRRAGAMATAAMLPARQTARRYRMGLQLYTLRAAMARDVDDTLSRVAAMGYERSSRAATSRTTRSGAWPTAPST